MPAPTFVQLAETSSWILDTSSQSTASFDVQAGDVIVSFAGIENGSQGGFSGVSGGSLTWTQRATSGSGENSSVGTAWSAIVDSNKSMSVTFTKAGSLRWGGAAVTFRGSDGIGNAASANSGTSTAAPSLNITTTQDNSAIVVFVIDWNAASGASRVWRQINGQSPVELIYDDDGVNNLHVVYAAYYANVGAAGAKTVGLTTPTMRYTILAVEVLGTEGGGGPIQETGILSAAGQFGSQFRARVRSSAAISARLEVGASMSARAAARAAIIAGIGASEGHSSAKDVAELLTAEVTAGEVIEAIAHAAAAIEAGLAAGEVWAARAQAAAELAAAAQFGAAFSENVKAVETGALTAGTAAAADFLSAASALASLSEGASITDAIAASSAALGRLAAGAQLGATFAYLASNLGAISAGARLALVFAIAASASASISERVRASDVVSSRASSAAAIGAGVRLGATFSYLISVAIRRSLSLAGRARSIVMSGSSRRIQLN